MSAMVPAELGRAEARTDAALSAALWGGLAPMTPHDAWDWYRHAGYPTPRRSLDHFS
jgi:hypothetical protein